MGSFESRMPPKKLPNQPLDDEMVEIKKSLTSLHQQIGKITTQQTHLLKLVEQVNTLQLQINNLQTKIKEKDDKIKTLEIRLDDLEQYSRMG